MNILFLCTANKNRSRTAEEYFRQQDLPYYKFLSAGLSAKECARNKSKLCSVELLEWANRVFVMEKMHQERIEEYTGSRFTDKIIVLGIEDIYSYYQPELISELNSKVYFS